jgi:hypothetical protein
VNQVAGHHQIRGRYGVLHASFVVTVHAAKVVNLCRSRTPARLYSYDTLLERLAQDFQDVACALGPFIQEAHAVMRPRYAARQRHLAADQADIRDGVVGGSTGARGDQGGAGAGAAGDVMDAGGVEGFGQRHGRQDGGEPLR